MSVFCNNMISFLAQAFSQRIISSFKGTADEFFLSETD